MPQELIIAMILATSGMLLAQDTQAPSKPEAAVKIFALSRNVFAWGERIRIPVALINRGREGFYISKHFSEAQGGSSGFVYKVVQLSGKPARFRCVLAGDRGPDSRSADQVFREDYIYLPPGGFVGDEISPNYCKLENPGRYRIEIWYSAQDLNVKRVAELKDLKWPVLQGVTEPGSVVIEIKRALGTANKPDKQKIKKQ